MTSHRRTPAAVIAAALMLLTACSITGSASSHHRTQITVLEKWGDPQYASYWHQVVTKFEAAHPDIHVKLMEATDESVKDKLQVLASAHDLPDIYFSWAGAYAQKFVKSGYAADLTDDLRGSAWGKRLDNSALEAYQHDGNYYGVPIDLDAKQMAYNKSIFRKYNLSVPRTLDQLLSTCHTLRRHNVTPIAFGNQYGWPAMHYLTDLTGKYVPQEVRNKDYVSKHPSWTHPGYVKALKAFGSILNDCTPKGANATPHDNAVANFANQKSAMVYVQSLESGNITSSDLPTKRWNFFPLPSNPGAQGDRKSIAGAPDGFMVNSQSEHKQASIKFLKYLTSRPQARKLVQNMGRLSSVRNTTDAKSTIPQLESTSRSLKHVDNYNVWLDTALDTSVSNTYLSALEGFVNDPSTPRNVINSVRAASKKNAHYL